MRMLGYKCMASKDLIQENLIWVERSSVFEQQECWKLDPGQADCLDTSRIPVSG